MYKANTCKARNEPEQLQTFLLGPCVKEICICSTSFVSTTVYMYGESHWELFYAEDAVHQVFTDRLYVILL